jgi:hypothetical protein
MKFRHLRLIAGLAAVVATALSAAPAQAGSRVLDLSGKHVDVTGLYCAYYAPTKVLKCATTARDMDAARAAAVPATAAASFLMGEFYDNTGYSKTAGYLDWFDSAGCTSSLSDVDSTWSDTTTWRARISSFKGFSNCRIAAYELTNYGGAALGYATARSSLGVLNNHVWSARFS